MVPLEQYVGIYQILDKCFKGNFITYMFAKIYLYFECFTAENGLEESFSKLWLMMCQFQDTKPRTLLAFVFGKQKLLLRISICFSLTMDNMNLLHSFILELNR